MEIPAIFNVTFVEDKEELKSLKERNLDILRGQRVANRFLETCISTRLLAIYKYLYRRFYNGILRIYAHLPQR